MSDRSPLAQDASKLQVVAALRGWLNLRHGFTERTPIHLLETMIDSLAEAPELAWDSFSALVWAYDLVHSLRHYRLGLWSNVRTRSGKDWTGVPTITRAVRQQLVRVPHSSESHSNPNQFHGLGCVAMETDALWLSDQVLYAVKDCLEPADDYRFYAYDRDPDFREMKDSTHEWGFLQAKWFAKVGGQNLKSGWINSPRYVFPLHAHRLSRESLIASAAGAALWDTALEVSALCPATVTDSPEPWWQDRTLFPSRDMLWSWASSTRRAGYGIITHGAIVNRDIGDPCFIPALLNSIAPGQPPREQFWQLMLLVQKLNCSIHAPTREVNGRTTWEMDQSSSAALRIERGNGWAVASTAAFVAHLWEMTLLPKHYGQTPSDPLPHKSVLKAGLWDVLINNAIPVRIASLELDDELNALAWAWSASGGRPIAPPGYVAVDRGQLESMLRRPVEPELGSNLTLKAI